MIAHLPPMQTFRQIPVVPVSALRGMVAHGGPIWPDFDNQIAARHCRQGSPSDRRPADPRNARRLRRPAVWGGYLVNQFGHLIAEQTPRLPQSLRERPNDLYLFTVQPGQDEDAVPRYVWDVLDWYGLRRSRARVITSPILVDELHVAAQGEMLGKFAISAEYLDLVEATAARNELEPVVSDIVFVTRAGMLARGMAGHLGESYLAEVLSRLGVRVLNPAVAPLREQLAVYAGAKVLVFSEGSALHGRGLLGRIDQDIHVLRRRFNHRIGQSQIEPRCRSLQMHTTVERYLAAAMPGGRPRPDLAASVYDLEVLFACFAEIGLDLAAHWNADDYRAAQQTDAKDWLTACPLSDEKIAENIVILQRIGLPVDLPPRPLPPNTAYGDRAVGQP